jgi:hypothetical protein
MNQDILVYMIIIATVFYVGYSLFKNLIIKKNKNGCNGCTGCDLTQKPNCEIHI